MTPRVDGSTLLRLVKSDDAQPLRDLYAGIAAGVDIFAEAAADPRLKDCGLSVRSTAALEAVQEAMARLRAELAADMLQTGDLIWSTEPVRAPGIG